MVRLLAAFALLTAAFAADPVFEVEGRFEPAGPAGVTLWGATTPFQANTISDQNGRFRFRNIRPGAYTIAVMIPDRGEARQTIEVGPSQADKRGRVKLVLQFRESDFELKDSARREHSVSAKQLTIPAKAVREYEAAVKDLSRRDIPAAIAHVERAIELAPQFAVAWNLRGTMAYQTRDYERAERCFRAAIEQDPKAYEPFVNLGGVLINNRKLDEALAVNQDAVKWRPNDALANSQLGMTYFRSGNFDQAVKYLNIARRIDPAHFSHPQTMLAEIHFRRGNPQAAVEMLEEFLQQHPDDPAAAKIRETIAALK